jgi:hypothetical protein
MRLVAGALPLDQATIERDLMRLADTPAKLKKSIFRTTVFRQSMRVYVTYGDLERRVLGICTTLTGWGIWSTGSTPQKSPSWNA